MSYYVYVLESLKDGSYYIGSTDNLERRLKNHNLGYSKYTKSKRPYIIIYFETFNSRKDACIRERFLKAKKSRKYINILIQINKD